MAHPYGRTCAHSETRHTKALYAWANCQPSLRNWIGTEKSGWEKCGAAECRSLPISSMPVLDREVEALKGSRITSVLHCALSTPSPRHRGTAHSSCSRGPRNQKPHCREKELRNFADTNANCERCGPPHKIIIAKANRVFHGERWVLACIAIPTSTLPFPLPDRSYLADHGQLGVDLTPRLFARNCRLVASLDRKRLGTKFPARRTGPEAFSMRRQVGSRWRSRRTG